MFNKKSVCLAVVLGCASTCVSAVTGSYVGVVGGFNHTKTDVSNVLDYQGILNNLDQTVKADNSKSGASFAGLVGYTYDFGGDFFAGLEVQFGKNTGDVKSNKNLVIPNGVFLTSGQIATTVKHSFGVSPLIVLGYKFTESFSGALKIGANISRFSTRTNYSANVGNVIQYQTADSRKTTQTGFVAGVSGEYAVTDSVSIVAEGLYTQFGSKKSNLTNPTAFPGAAPQIAQSTHTSSIKPRFITARVGAIYRF